jgi:kinesin family member 6/9
MCGGESYQERGLIPRTLGLVFEELHYREQNDQKSFKCLISFTEVFGEAVYDLLDADKQYQPLEEWSRVQIFETEDGLTLRNINVFEVTSEEEALNLFFMGTVNR